MSVHDREAVRDFYDALGKKEWLRLEADPAGRVSFEIHRRFLQRFVTAGMRVLEVGAGPGRFTIELARMGAHVVVTDYSPVQLALNQEVVGGTHAERAVVSRSIMNVCDTSAFPDASFDAVVAYGGPLSYAFDETENAIRGLLRVTRPGGPVIASVMSVLGTWRFFLREVAELVAEQGDDVNDAILATGDTRLRGGGHPCKMFRSHEIIELVQACGGAVVAASASNWASMNAADLVEAIEADPNRWARFLDNEVAACASPGAWDGGTHFLLAATMHKPHGSRPST